jgi:hypothetical protein
MDLNPHSDPDPAFFVIDLHVAGPATQLTTVQVNKSLFRIHDRRIRIHTSD